MNGQLLQMDKKYSALKQKQKEKIGQWMYDETLVFYNENHKMPMGHRSDDIVDKVYKRITDEQIWIPYNEIYKQYIKRKTKIINKINKRLSDQQE